MNFTDLIRLRLYACCPKAFIRMMKIVILLMTTVLLEVSAATHAQITLRAENTSLEKVIKDLKKQSGYDFFYNDHDLLKAAPVTVDLRNATLEEALKACFSGQNLSYTIEEKTVVIKEKEPTVLEKIKKALTPPTDIIGRVTNTHGQPLNGATVTIKRTQTGTLTDANGNFTVRGVLPTDTLVFSYLGYKRAFVRLGEQKDLKIVLEDATNQLDQVVIQAYGETSQRLATGTIGTVTAKDIEKQPVMNVLQALQGQIPGVIVTNTSGYASGSIKVEIRGRTSVNGAFPTDPLYIIDGVPLSIEDLTGNDSYATGSQGVIQSGITSPASGQSPFFSLNPADIESISVLKDADATAIYGSRGANGVILITTKKGKAGKTHLDMSVYQGLSHVDRTYDLMNTQQYVSMREEALKNDGLPVNNNTAPDLIFGGSEKYTNWQKYLFGGFGKTTDAEASISGGDEHTTFRIGAGYHYLTEILTSNGANKRGSLSFNINHRSLNQRFSILFTGSYSAVSSDMINVPGSITLPPNSPSIYDSKGNLNFAGWDAFIGFPNANPFGSLLRPYTTSTNFLNGNAVFSYDIIKGLKIKTSVGYDNVTTNQTFLQTIASMDPVLNPTGTSSIGITQVHNLIAEPQLEYNSVIAKGKLNVLLGGSIQSNNTTGDILFGNGYTNDALLTEISAAPYQSGNNNLAEFRYEAFFGRINYNWEDKYILNLNARRDGDTRFAPGRQFGNFASIGGAWNFSEEKWFKENISFISFAKLRGSYGTTGSDQIGNYQYLSKWQYGNTKYNGYLPLYPQGHTDSLLHWQVNKKLELALDLNALKDRLNFEVVFYRGRCNDQLVNYPTPGFTGFSFVTTNSPADVQNEGWEFALNAKIVDNNDFKWSTRFNIGFNSNKLLAFPNLAQSPYSGNLIIGQSVNIVRKLHFTGVDPLTGQYAFEDKNHDGQITYDQSGKTSDDSHPIDMSPKFDGGLTNDISYKNLKLSFFFYFKKQLGGNALAYLQPPGGILNQPIEDLQRWQNPGDITNVAKFTTRPGQAAFYYQAFSDATISDASFIRLKNVSLTYSVPDRLAKKVGANNVNVFFRAENLFIITRYKDADPETQIFGGLPVARVMTAGVSCNF